MRVLYHFARSPFSRRVRLALALKNLPVELREARETPAFRDEATRLYPVKTIPVLVDEDGTVVGDSSAIGLYLEWLMVAGAAAGTTVALGAYNGWWPEAGLPATTAGSIAVGGVAAIGALAMTDAVFNPCAGFHALFDLSHGECVDGHYVGPHAQPVGYAPPVVHYRHARHDRHHRYYR